MRQYKLWHGLAGGFGGARDYEIEECENEEEAIDIAYELACQDYESYVGLHGLRDIEQIMEEDEIEDEEEAWESYSEERSSWLDYYVEELEEGFEDEESIDLL